ncbi:MAG: DNA-directed RNA polymerase subunit omega [Eubacteriales bacterium]|nr:DNA-directed RNA polymerase subunit omega [Eubacteriales bacterium]
MIEPPISSLLEKTDSRYTLVILAAKRARQITEGARIYVKVNSVQTVTIAVNEINEEKITYVRNLKPVYEIAVEEREVDI